MNQNTSPALLTIEEARTNKLPLNWQTYTIQKPIEIGIKSFEDYPIDQIRTFIDWSPFFFAWGLKGRYPAVLHNEKYGMQAGKLFEDAQELLQNIIDNKRLTAKAVIGLFPANSVGDDIVVYSAASHNRQQTIINTLRQQIKKREGQSNLALADFVAPMECGKTDYIGAFTVTTGIGMEHQEKLYNDQHDDYHLIMLKAIGDRLAEAFAELLHARVRREWWGYARHEALTDDEIIQEKYRGIRPAPGYPACPDHSEKVKIFDLLQSTEHTSVTLTDHFGMHPSASICGYYFAHPQARYFRVGQIQKDQVVDYARRKQVKPAIIEKLLSTYLTYQ
ncbi:MAG: hypothetical protein GF313_02640 [Caldithrix sp.]|nr:hypothetical protein [Caldithrix sp.]